MFNLLQKFLNIVESVVVLLVSWNAPVATTSPTPLASFIVEPTSIVENITSTPTPVPKLSPTSIPPTPYFTPKPSPTPISVEKLVEQITELKQQIASFTPEPTPTPQIVYVTPTPSLTPSPIPVVTTIPTPTPIPLIATLSESLIPQNNSPYAILEDHTISQGNVHIRLNHPRFVSKVVLEIVDENGQLLDMSGSYPNSASWLLLSWVTAPSDSRYFGGQGNSARQWPTNSYMEVSTNPVTIPINAELDTINWIGSATRKDIKWFYKITSIGNAIIQYQP